MAGHINFDEAKLSGRWITKTESAQLLKCSEFHHIIEQPLFLLFIKSIKFKPMFSGIVEEMATLVAMTKDKENIDFTLKCSFTDELKIDQSIAHNGVCLTVVSMENGTYTVTATRQALVPNTLTYTIHADGNVVLNVSLDPTQAQNKGQLRRLGIADKVSGFSTRLDEVAYLEEDDDYDLFCKAKAARGETVAVKKVYREYNPVSNYPGYYRD